MSTRWLPTATSPAELTIPHAAEIRAAWLERLADHPRGVDIELDLSGVGEIDSAGVQLLLALRATLAERGALLRVEIRSGWRELRQRQQAWSAALRQAQTRLRNWWQRPFHHQ